MRFEKSPLRKEIEKIEDRLSPENKAYLGKLNGYMMLTSLFHAAEDQMESLLLPIYQDVLQAQEDGMSAEDYLGKDTKTMADELLADLPPMKWHYGLRVTGNLALIYLGWHYMMEFAMNGYLQVEPIGLICDIVLALILPALAFYLLKGLIYSISKAHLLLTYIGFGLVFVGVIVFRWWLARYAEVTVYPLPMWLSLLGVLGFGLGLYAYRQEAFLRYTFLPTYVILLLAGFWKMGLDAAQLAPNHFWSWVQVGFVLLAPLATMLGLPLYYLRREKRK